MKNPALLLSFSLLLSSAAGRCAAQQHTPKPEAQAAYDQAEKLPFGDPREVALFRKAIEIDPDFPEAQQYYILAYSTAAVPRTGTDAEKKAAVDKARQTLLETYAKWAEEHPKDAVYPWALGILWEYADPDRSVGYYKKAIALDPSYGAAYDMLSIAAEAQGNLEQSRAYEAKAHQVWPTDKTIWRHYLGTFTTTGDSADLERAKEIALEMAGTYPQQAVSMLAYVAGRSTDPAQARAMYELLRQKFPQEVGGNELTPLFALDMASDPQSALELATAAQKADATKKSSSSAEDDASAAKLWNSLADYASAVVKARRLIAQGQGSAALTLLDQVKPPARTDMRPLALTRASALEATGQKDQAYTVLRNTFAATPSNAVYAALLECGNTLGKNKAQVDADVNAQRSSVAKPGRPFSLTDYATGKPVSLADYKGRVVLVNFWYPMCGPCRGEFPYIQMALDKYKDRGFAVLAINGHPPEDDWVLPLIRGWRLGFTPLKSTEEVLKAYKVHGFPDNFLYGADGRVYPMPPQVRPQTLEEFELQIEGLLAQAKAAPGGDKTAAGGDKAALDTDKAAAGGDSAASAAPALPATVDECVSATKALQESLTRQNHDKMNSLSDYDHMVSDRVAAYARACAARFQPASVQGADLMALAQLDIQAGQWSAAQTAIELRLAAPGLSETQKADLQLETIRTALAVRSPEGRQAFVPVVDHALQALDAMSASCLPQQIMAYRLGGNFYTSSPDAEKRQRVANGYIALYRKLPAADRSGDLRFGVYKAFSSLADLHSAAGNRSQAEDDLRNGILLLSDDPEAERTIGILKYDLGRYQLVGQKAKPLLSEHWINGAPADDRLDLAGQVTLIEFTAHWCVPCRESYPALQKLEQEYAGKHLQIVLATTLFGYFGSERHLSPQQEIADDTKYYTQELRLPFRVAVGQPLSGAEGWDANSRNYFSQGVPQFVIVDRRGIVRDVMVGIDGPYEPVLSAALDKVIGNS